MIHRIAFLSITACLTLFACTVQAPPPAQPMAAQQPIGQAPPPAAEHGVADADAGQYGPQGQLTPWQGPIICRTTEDLIIENAVIEGTGNGPTIQGSCDIVITNSRIDVGGTALVLMGSGDIQVSSSFVRGAGGALQNMGSGDVQVSGSHVVGAMSNMGSGDVAFSSSLVEGERHNAGTGGFRDDGSNVYR